MEKGGVVIVVDDDDAIRELLPIFLGQYFKEVLVFEKPEDAIACMEDLEGQPTVVLTDMEMPPYTDGITFIKKMMGECPCPLLLGMSGNGHGPEALEAGAKAFFQKPMPYDKLAAAIAREAGII